MNTSISNNTRALSKRAAYNKFYYEANKQKKLAQSKSYYEANKETIKRRARAYNKAYHKANKEANKEKKAAQDKAYYEANKETRKVRDKVYSRAYYKANKEKRAASDKAWRENNKEKIYAAQKARYKKDPLYKVKELLRGTVCKAFARLKQNKPTNTQSLLGCTYEEAKSHFELLFNKGMSWSNYGEWHVDHIRPVSSFGLDELHLMNHISNLQPLWAKDNLVKGDRWKDNT
jgi:hypothetical protein